MNLGAYIFRRTAIAIVLLVGLTFLTFWLYDLTPMDPARVVLGGDPGRPIPADQRKVVDHAIGVDQPLTTVSPARISHSLPTGWAIRS